MIPTPVETRPARVSKPFFRPCARRGARPWSGLVVLCGKGRKTWENTWTPIGTMEICEQKMGDFTRMKLRQHDFWDQTGASQHIVGLWWFFRGFQLLRTLLSTMLGARGIIKFVSPLKSRELVLESIPKTCSRNFIIFFLAI